MKLDDVWGWFAPIIVWCGDHYSMLFALVLFLLQCVYQTIRIRKLCKSKKIPKDLEDGD